MGKKLNIFIIKYRYDNLLDRLDTAKMRQGSFIIPRMPGIVISDKKNICNTGIIISVCVDPNELACSFYDVYVRKSLSKFKISFSV